MENTTADIRQLFNVKALVGSGTPPSAVPDNTFAIIDEATNLSVYATSHAALPDRFRFVSKLNGRTYYSIDTMDKACCGLGKGLGKEYRPESPGEWEVLVSHCGCIRSVQLNVHVETDVLLRNHGLTWADRDSIVVVTREEMERQCDCDKGVVHETWQNHVVTRLLYEKVLTMNSPFYTAAVRDESGNFFTGMAALEAFINSNKAVNTDSDDTNDSDKLVLVLRGKPQPAGSYADLEANYVWPRGVRLKASAAVNNGLGIAFTEVSAPVYEVGSGYDLRAEEFEAMSLWTGLNHYPQLSCGLANSSGLVYQFENGKNYHTVTFEASSPKSGLGDAPGSGRKRWSILLGAENLGMYNVLKGVFA